MTAIKVDLLLADGSFTSGMLRAGQTVNQFNAQVLKSNPGLQAYARSGQNIITSIGRAEGVTKDFLGTMRDLSIVTGVVSMGVSAVSGAMTGWFGEIVRINAEMQRMQIMMQGMSKSADPLKEAGDNVKYLRDMAMNTPFSLDTLTSGFVKLQSTGIDPVAGSMQSLADGIAAFGGSDQQFERAVVAITQMSGKGVIQMEELRQQLGEHMPRAVELMARSMGVGIAELLQEISTGTMAATPALNAFYSELERTYGGRAQAMMNTFAGQMKQTHTLWTNIVTQIGGMNQQTYAYSKDGLFMTITDQLRDLNEILAQPFAFNIADNIGSGLANVVRLIRGTIGTLVEFRREIQFVATALAIGFGGKAILGMLGQVGTSFAGLVAQARILKIEMASAGSWFAAASGGMTSLNTITTATRMNMIGLGIGIKAAGTAFMVALPWIALIGTAVYAAAQYFDIFGNKTRNALEDLKAFGAETRAQAESTIDAQRQQLISDIEHAEWVLGAGGAAAQAAQRRLVTLRQELAELEAQAPGLIKDAGIREDQATAAAFQREIDEEIMANQRKYDALARQTQDYYDKAIQAEGANVDALEEERRVALFNARKAQLEQNNEFFRELMAANVTAMEAAVAAEDEALIAGLERKQGILNANLLETGDALRELEKAGANGTGIEHFANPEGNAEAIAKGKKNLADMRREIQEMKLQLNGATSAHAELQVAIANGDYGSVEQGGKEVAELHAELIAATKAKEALDRIMEGRSKAEEDVEKLRTEALERRFELMVEMREHELGRKLRPAEVLQMRINNGMYEGVGNRDQIEADIQAIVDEFGGVELGAEDAGTAIQDKAFGNDTVSRIQAVNNEVAILNGTLGQTSALANGITFGGFDGFLSGGSGTMAGMGPLGRAVPTGPLPQASIDRMAMAMGRLMSHGWSKEVAAAIVGNIGGESGYNPNAINPGDGADGSDSIGLVQWNSGRARALKQFAAMAGTDWTDFMTQIDFVNWELNNTHKSVGNKLRGPVSLEGATNTVLREYEVPADPGSKYGTRLGYAQQAYGQQIETSNAQLQVQNDLIDQGVAKTLELETTIADVDRIDQQSDSAEWLLNRNRLVDELNQKLTTLGSGVATGDQNMVDTVREMIGDGELGDMTNADSRQYEDLLAMAAEIDRLNAKIATDKKLQTELDRETASIEEDRVALNQRLADLRAQQADPNYVPESQTIRSLEAELDAYIAKLTQLHGAEHQLTRNAIATKQQMLRDARMVEVTEEQMKLSQQTQQINTSLMTERQQRQHAMQQQLAAVDAWMQRARQTSMTEVEIVREAEAAKAAIRQQYAQATNPMAAQMAEWADLQGNLAQASTQWMDSLAGGLTDLIMGTGDLKSVINGILRDLINMSIKAMIGGMKGGGAGGKAGKMGGGGGKKAMFGVAHTGGIIGASQLRTRRASAMAFAGAPKFHGGGIIGPRLMPSEVPIIAQEGEGVFTKEQMANLQPAGMGGQTISINSPITVNGSAGTPEQNQDLAKRMRREMEAGFRAIAADEMRKQMKAGNILNTRSRS